MLFVLLIGTVVAGVAWARRSLFPYCLVFLLGLEYFGASSATTLLTVPKVGLAFLAAVQILRGRYRLAYSREGLFVALLIFVGYLSATFLWSADPVRSLIRSVSLVLLLLTYSLVEQSIRDLHQSRHYWRAYLMFATANAAVAIFQVQTGWRAVASLEGVRAGGLALNPTQGAFSMGMGLLVLVACYFGSNPGLPLSKWRMWRHPILAILLVGVISTASRGGVVAIVLALGILGLLGLHKGLIKRPILMFGIVLGVLAAVAIGVPDRLDFLIQRGFAAGADDLGNRLTIWSSALEHIRDHPLIGNGLDGTMLRTSLRRGEFSYSAHNTPLTLLLDGGLVALILVAFVARRAWVRLRVLLNQSGQVGRTNGVLIAAQLSLAAVVMLSHDMLFRKSVWVVLGILEGVAIVSLRRGDPVENPAQLGKIKT
jgi:O-antigen ligase